MHSEILANEFSRAGHNVRIVTWSTGGTGKIFPFTVVRNPSNGKLAREHYWADVVLENNPAMRLSWPLLFLKKPLVIALHTWITRTNGQVSWMDKLKKRRLKLANRVIACSDAVRIKNWPDAVTITNPYQADRFNDLPHISKTEDFVFLGRLVSDKGVDVAIHAFHKLLKANCIDTHIGVSLSFTIIGDGPERNNLEHMVVQLGLEKNIRFTGARREEALVECLNAHRFLLVPSVWEEPFGMVALEGMACGCVPIVSDGGGLPGAVGKAGLTFQRGNVDSLVATIRKILNDPALERSLRHNATEHLLAHRQSYIAQQYLAVLEKAARKNK